MTRNVINRLSGIACVGSAILAVLALVGFLVVVGSDPIATAAEEPAFYVPTVAALASTALLGLGLVGLYLRQEERLGALGVVGFVTSLLGTILAAGAQWTYVFVVPHFAPVTPELINESTGAVLAGFVLSYFALAIGWALFGIATARAGVFPRGLSILVVVGAVIAFLPLPSRTLVLTIGVALLGLRLLRHPSSSDRAVLTQG